MRSLNFTLNQCAADTKGHTRHNKGNMEQHADTLSLYIHTEIKTKHMVNEARVYFVTIQTDTLTHKAILALNEVYTVLSMSKQHFHTQSITHFP